MATLIAVFVMLTTLLLISPARAHYVWIERDGDGPARAYFGEWIDNTVRKPAVCSIASKRLKSF